MNGLLTTDPWELNANVQLKELGKRDIEELLTRESLEGLTFFLNLENGSLPFARGALAKRIAQHKGVLRL